MENPEQFNIWKNQVEDINPNTQLECLRVIEINLSNICNLKCSYCPQSIGWSSNKIKFMTVETVKEIVKQLYEAKFNGYLCLAGYGEPSLNPNFEEIVTLLKDFRAQLITNGIPGEKEMWERLDKIAQIKISVHNWDNIEWFKHKFGNTKAWYRNHDEKNPQINLYNRNGYLNKPVTQITRSCYIPYYSMFIDVDGKYLQCMADWEHKSENNLSIFNTSIKEYFEMSAESIRENLSLKNGRQNCSCCRDCDINGLMTGVKFVEFWKNDKKR